MSRLLRPVSRKWSRRWASAVVIGMLLGCVALAFVPRSIYGTRLRSFASNLVLERSQTPQEALQSVSAPLSDRLIHLSSQPEADRLRRRLGQRFIAPGREMATLIGTLTIGTQQYTARITRTQDDSGEAITVGLNGGAATLLWNGQTGAISSGRPATGDQRALLERIAMDSPDEFILAQLRGASYYTVARSARPVQAGGSDNYSGPTWDLIRIVEPSEGAANKLQSSWRLYYINSATGLIEKVISQEQGQTIVAEISGWLDQGGEKVPTHITWTQNQQTVMELTLKNVAIGQQ